MTIEATEHLSLTKTRSSKSEKFCCWGLRLCSYAILLAAGIIFVHIFLKGAPVVFQASAPFVNVEFLTSHPQTLHVFEPRSLVEERLDRPSSIEHSSATGNLDRRSKDLDRRIRAASILYSDTEFRLLEELPNENDFVYSSYAYSAGGIGTAIVGTILLIVGSIIISLLLGVSSAIYISEYSRPGIMLHIIRLSVLNLSGVPAIVFGLFGFGIFVLFFGWGVSLLAGWFTLAMVALPTIIAASENALQDVPQSYREAALGLGADKWTTIRTTVLPYALPQILTASILAIARVAGETAAILFTAAFALRDQLPWQGVEKASDTLFQGVMALPYHIYVLCAKLPQNLYTQDMQYGTVFVLLALIGMCAITSIYLRQRIRSQIA